MSTETIFRIAFWVLFGGLVLMRAYFSLRVRRAGERVMPDREAVEREGKAMFVFRVVVFLILLAVLALYGLSSPWLDVFAIPLPDSLRSLRWAGFVLGLAGLAFWTWTQAALGKEWSPQLQVREEHHLVTAGPYARIRHPLYTAMFGVVIAFALVSANWIFVVLAALAIVGVVVRVPREERMMIEEFGEEYRAYMQRTGRFFPKI
jgi:protein-S-isoprenylcysteine O-methyltransferase Ste14